MTLKLVIFSIGVVVFVGLALYLLIQLDRQRRRHQARLRRIRPDIPRIAVNRRKRKGFDKSEKLSIFARIEAQLSQTNMRLSLVELLVQVSLAVLGLYALLVLFFALHPLMALPIAVALPILLAGQILRFAKNRYRAAFTTDLPEALDVFARGLRAGRPITDSLCIVVDTAKGPTQREFSRCYDEICMGTTLPDSLHRLETRIPTPEVSFFAVATALQAETGGNLIETMESLASQLRERRKLRRKARALSSEARASALILASLPFAVALIIGFLNGAYLEPLIMDPRGRIMSITAITSISLGVYTMAKMGKLNV